jgi:hypothetical protein
MVALYLWARAGAGAHMPWSAPADYRPVYAAGHLAANALQYADRVLTFPLVVVMLAWLATWRATRSSVPALVPGLLWAAVALLPTIALPVRSSLYSLLPLAATAVAAGQLIELRLAQTDAAGRTRVAAAAVMIALILIPIHRARHRDWSGAARLSSQVAADAGVTLRDVAGGSRILVRDRFEQPNLESAFGNLLPEMLLITTGKRFDIVAAPPGPSILLAPVAR